MREVFALDQFHHERVNVIRLFESVNDGDVGMVERGKGLGFTFKAPEPIGVVRERDGQDLECDLAIEFGIARAIDLAHATDTQQRSDVIDADRFADQIHSQMPNGGV